MSSNSNDTALTINAVPSESIPLAQTKTSSVDVNLPSSRPLSNAITAFTPSPQPHNSLQLSLAPKTTRSNSVTDSSSSERSRRIEALSSLPSSPTAIFSSSAPAQKGLFYRSLVEKRAGQPSPFSPHSSENNPKREEPLSLSPPSRPSTSGRGESVASGFEFGNYPKRGRSSSLSSQFKQNASSVISSFLPSLSRTRSSSVSEQSSSLAPPFYFWEQPRPESECTVHSILTDLSLTSRRFGDHNKIACGQPLSKNLNIQEAVVKKGTINIIILGHPQVGKSSLLRRIIDGTYTAENKDSPPCSEKEIKVWDHNIKLKIWDTGSLFPLMHRGDILQKIEVAAICFDAAKKESLDSIKQWNEEVTRYCTNPNLKIVIVATKCDLVEATEVTYAEAKEYAEKVGCYYFETSAKNGMHHEHLATALALAPFEEAHEEELNTILSRPGYR